MKQASMVKFLQEEIDLKIHEFRFEDGRSALHYLLKENECSPRYDVGGKMAKRVVDYFLEDSVENHQDDQGYTYFHAACMSGNVAKVKHFLEQGVDVNLSTYTCSPLHIAAQYRQTDVVRVLLEKGADPNILESSNQSRPLHALAWQRWCICECDHYCHSCEDNKPAFEIVVELLERGADIEARDIHGDTPLQAAVSCFDLELTRAILKLGASLGGLNEDRVFARHFEIRELKYRPLTMNMIEVVEFLQSAGFKMDFATRLEMIKCWMRVRGNGADHLLPIYVTESNRHLLVHFFINFYMEHKPYDYLWSEMRRLKGGKYFSLSKIPLGFLDEINLETAQLKSIMLNEKVSLHEICQMSFDKGYSIVKKIKNFQLPRQLNDLTLSKLLVKRHCANILIRPHLELAVADLFMTDKCGLNLPYVVCRQIAENMSHADLLRLCEKGYEENEVQPLPEPKRRRLC
uniref:SOCS box domain-containing protein n=1 Tax=Trichogramma kaykai TaxID=54128 RepID=A0ABD2WWQ2_9HYME